MTISNKGKPGSRKRKFSDADPEPSEEETTTVAPEKPVANKKKNKQKDMKAQKSQKNKAVQEEPEVEGSPEEETTAVAPEKPVVNKKKNKKKDKKSQKSKAIQEEPEVADEDSSEGEGTNAGISTQRLKETPKSKSGSGSAASKDADRRDERDRQTLFLKNLPGNCTVRQIKALSKEIKHVRLRFTFSVVDNRRKKIGFAFVAFASEAAAERNFKTLEAAVIRGAKITVDYVGAKSKYQSTKRKTEPVNVDPLRLYVSGLPGNATQEDLLKLFPGAVEVQLPRRNKDKLLFGYAFLTFTDADLAKEHHEKGQDLTLQGRKLVVLYAESRREFSGKTSEKQKKEGAKAAAKQEVEMEQDDDDDEEADDDDEEDEEEEDDE